MAQHLDASTLAPGSPPVIQHVISAGATDRGLVRESNQDHFVVAEMTRAMHIGASSLAQPSMLFGNVNIRGHLFVVADGMGGQRGGEQASALAVVTIEDYFLNMLRLLFRMQGDALLQEFQLALRAADDRIFAEAERRPELRGMGTTVTMAYAVDRVLYVVHAGDSRLYAMRAGILYQLTTDHTLVGELVRNHIIQPEDAATHPMRNIITNSVGGDTRGVTPEVRKVPLEVNDTILVCSDGLTGMVTDAEIAAILTAEADPAAACARLIERANALGGTDNVTAIVARFLP
jgi:serine/threonine protein phosphatase PrpC